MELLKKLTIESATPDVDSDVNPDVEFRLDPEPGERANSGRKTVTKPAPIQQRRPAVTVAKMAKEVADNLTTLLELGGAVWGISDECCAPVLEMQARPMADAMTAILARNPKMLAQFAQADIAVLAVQTAALWKACQPLLIAIYRNHISGAVDDDTDQNGDSGNGRINLGDYPAYTGAATRPVPA
jgi:hypothetical protein